MEALASELRAEEQAPAPPAIPPAPYRGGLITTQPWVGWHYDRRYGWRAVTAAPTRAKCVTNLQLDYGPFAPLRVLRSGEVPDDPRAPFRATEDE